MLELKSFLTWKIEFSLRCKSGDTNCNTNCFGNCRYLWSPQIHSNMTLLSILKYISSHYQGKQSLLSYYLTYLSCDDKKKIYMHVALWKVSFYSFYNLAKNKTSKNTKKIDFITNRYFVGNFHFPLQHWKTTWLLRLLQVSHQRYHQDQAGKQQFEAIKNSSWSFRFLQNIGMMDELDQIITFAPPRRLSLRKNSLI